MEQMEVMMGIIREKVLFMWGYLPGSTPHKLPLLAPFMVKMPQSFMGDTWKDVCGGGCGFAMAISELGKVITWGSTADEGPSYSASGKHEEIPEVFPLLADVPIAKAACGWAHCVTITDHGEVYAWGWKECVPRGKLISDRTDWVNDVFGGPYNCSTSENVLLKKHIVNLGGQDNSRSSSESHPSKISNQSGYESEYNIFDCNSKKRRRMAEGKKVKGEPSTAIPCLVTLGSGVQITEVAAGGRHVLALSDVGKVWGWGYGGEGQLGLGNRIKSVSSPQLIPCFKIGESSTSLNMDSTRFIGAVGSTVKAIACGGRHSAVITDTGALLTFGWGLYGQFLLEYMHIACYSLLFDIQLCGQGGTDDELSPTCVSSLLGVQIQGIAAGLWHTVCTSVEGGIYAFGGNNFGELGIGSDQGQTLPTLLNAPCLQNINAKIVSCGARHNAITTEEGKVFCWGWNKYGQLGLGDVIDRPFPCEVPMHGFFTKKASCGWWHTLVIAEYPS